MNLARYTTEDLLLLRKRAELRKLWSEAKRITDELAARGRAGYLRAS